MSLIWRIFANGPVLAMITWSPESDNSNVFLLKKNNRLSARLAINLTSNTLRVSPFICTVCYFGQFFGDTWRTFFSWISEVLRMLYVNFTLHAHTRAYAQRHTHFLHILRYLLYKLRYKNKKKCHLNYLINH